jgi:predicted MFS family arabinose efflux permease
MPIVGAVAAVEWRLCWVVVPLASAVVAVLAVRARRPDPPAATPVAWRALVRRGPIAGWAAGELLAYAGWGGTLVYAGALFVESHGLSPRATGVLLGLAALAYFPGTMLARRRIETSPRVLLIGLGIAVAVAVAVFGLVRPAAWFSWLAFAAAVGLAGGRAITGSAFGLDAAPDERVAVMAIRAAATQFGYLLGAGLGGLALAVGGYGALGAVLGARSRVLSALSGAALLASSAATRFGIYHGGVASAKDPKYTVAPQRQRLEKDRST